jgi:hypothetical protein
MLLLLLLLLLMITKLAIFGLKSKNLIHSSEHKRMAPVIIIEIKRREHTSWVNSFTSVLWANDEASDDEVAEKAAASAAAAAAFSLSKSAKMEAENCRKNDKKPRENKTHARAFQPRSEPLDQQLLPADK